MAWSVPRLAGGEIAIRQGVLLESATWHHGTGLWGTRGSPTKSLLVWVTALRAPSVGILRWEPAAKPMELTMYPE